MDEKEKQIAIKILDRVLATEGITNTNCYDGLLQFIYDELKAIQVQARVSPKVAEVPTHIEFEVKDIIELLAMVDSALQPDFPINKSQMLLQKIKIICLKYGINWTGRQL